MWCINQEKWCACVSFSYSLPVELRGSNVVTVMSAIEINNLCATARPQQATGSHTAFDKPG